MERPTLALTAVAVFFFMSAGTAWGEDANMPQRMAAMEKQVGQLTELVKAQAQALQAAQQSNNELKAKLNDVDWTAAKAAVMKDAEKKNDTRHNLWSNLDVQLYGKIKADAAVDTSRTDTGNFARWVNHESTNRDDHQMNVTANETRLGLKFNGPDVGEAKTSGLVEFDFFGGGAENKSTPMMRHAYMQIDWAKCGLSLLAGQTWDVISPLNPTTLNYSVQWWAGNIGYRRPQIRLTKVCELGGGTVLKLETAVARDIGRTSGFDPGDSGEDSGLPSLQGRASLSFPFLAEKKATFGVSGHYSQEEYDTDAAGHNLNADSWSANLDMDLPILKWLAVKGEMFTGQDLDAYLGGIGQGVVVDISGEVGDYDLYSPEMLMKKAEIKKGDILIIKTGWHKFGWNSPESDEFRYMVKHPGPSPDFSKWAIDMKIKWIGVDAVSADHPMNTIMRIWHPKTFAEANAKLIRDFGKDWDQMYPLDDYYQDMHLNLFPKRIVHAENLAGDIAQAKGGRYYIGCYLQKAMEAESMWGRFVAFKEG
jgi:kynurenine formamidase